MTGPGSSPSTGETYYIARCPVHGLHGERQECFVCGGPVEQVPMRPVRTSRWWSKIAAGIVLAPFAVALSPVIAAMWLVSWAYKQIGVDAWE